MNGFIRLVSLIFCFTFTSTALAQHDHSMMGPKPGKYFGYIKLEGLNSKIPASLDLVVVQDDKEYVHLRGIFKIMLGGFQSFEYVTQFYEKVSYSWVRQELTFENDQRELTLANGRVHMMNMKLMIMGNFRSSAGGVTGKVTLVHYPDSETRPPERLQSTIFPGLPVLPALTGSYKGTCEEEDYELQLEATKWQGTGGFSTNPLVGYMIRGRLGKRSQQVCGENDRYCVERSFTDGSYNLYRGQLELTGRLKNLRCSVHNINIQCGPCRFAKDLSISESVDKDKSFKMFEREIDIGLGKNETLPNFPEPNDLKGNFIGVLHHEATNSYQHLKINVNAFKYTDRPNRPETLYVSANAWLYFGNPDSSNEFIGYKFDQRPYLDTAPNFLFEGGGDTFMKVKSWSSTAIVGEWYSKVFGKVGTVQLIRSETFLDIDISKLLPGLSGRYLGPLWSIDLTVRGNSNDFNEGGFYPLRVAGVARITDLTASQPITSGIFDFYTNTAAIELNGKRVSVGHLDTRGLHLFWPGKQRWGITMSQHHFETFQHQDSDGWK